LFPNKYKVTSLFEGLEPLELELSSHHEIEMEKETIENKLPEPYNQCKESLTNDNYHQWNCIEECVFGAIRDQYNCTFPSSLFSIGGLEQCDARRHGYVDLRDRFALGCSRQCPMESCFSEKFGHYTTSTQRGISAEFGKESLRKTRFRFSFRDLGSLSIAQIPKTDPFTFLNNVGGGLGLFMGIAFPNLIEFLQFVFELFSIILF